MSRRDWCEVCHWSRATIVHADADGLLWWSCLGCIDRLETIKSETLEARERAARAERMGEATPLSLTGSQRANLQAQTAALNVFFFGQSRQKGAAR